MPHPYDENDTNWTACSEGYTCERCLKEIETQHLIDSFDEYVETLTPEQQDEITSRVQRCHCGGTLYEHAPSCGELYR